MDFVFFQNSVNVASWCVFCDYERSTLERLDGNELFFGEGIIFGNNNIHRVIHDRKKLVAMILLKADKADINTAFLDPVGQFAFHALDNLYNNIGVCLLEFTDNLRNPVNRTAEIGANAYGALLRTVECSDFLMDNFVSIQQGADCRNK